MSNQPVRTGLILEPFDVLLFRDGRPLVAGWQVESGLPLPQTLTGTIRTWLLKKADCDFERFGEAVRSGATPAAAAQDGQPEAVSAVFAIETRGPWLAGRDDAEPNRWSPLVPMPANMVKMDDKDDNGRSDGEIFRRLDPLMSRDMPGWWPQFPGLRPLWRYSTHPAKKTDGFLSWEGLGRFLEGGELKRQDCISADDLFTIDARTGIAIDAASRAVEEGAIYGAGYLALRSNVAFYAEIVDPKNVLDSLGVHQTRGEIVRFGGDGRRSRMTTVPAVQWPSAAPTDGRGVAMLLTTPCPVDPNVAADNVWLPAPLRENLISAAVPGYRAFSGWDLARRGPKPSRFAVEAGAVFFLKPDSDFSDINHLYSAEDSVFGWGQVLKGVWNHA